MPTPMLSLPPDFAIVCAQAAQAPLPDLQQWIAHVLRRGARQDEIVEAMVVAGHPGSLAALLVALVSDGMLLAKSQEGAPLGPPSSGMFPSGPNEVILKDRSARRLVSTTAPSLDCAVYDNVLSPEECAALLAAAAPRLHRSGVGQPGDASDPEQAFKAMVFDREETPWIAAIERRLAMLVGYPVDQGEGLRVLRDGMFQAHRPRLDFFEPEAETRARTVSGNRIGTLVLYLSDVEEGGATQFPDAGLVVHPHQGMAIWFAYPPTMSPVRRNLSRHIGLPVVRGAKWIATKWVRERPFVATAPHQGPASTPLDQPPPPPAIVGSGAAANEETAAAPPPAAQGIETQPSWDQAWWEWDNRDAR